MRIIRRARRRIHCLRQGHRWQQHDQQDGELIITGDRCVHCRHTVVRGTRPLQRAGV